MGLKFRGEIQARDGSWGDLGQEGNLKGHLGSEYT